MSQVQKPKFAREDDYNPASDFSSSIQEKWIHKQVVQITGQGEDDFVIEEKPVLVESVDLHKQINEEAKTTDLKYLLKQFLMTGDESILNTRPGVYADITGVQKLVEGGEFVSADQIKQSLGEEFGELTVEQLASMSDKDIASYIASVREKKSHEEKKLELTPAAEEKKEGE